MNIIVSLIIGLIVAGIAVGNMVSKLKTVRSKSGAADYEKQNSFKLEEQKDTYLYKKVESTPKPKN